jgi:hypothetical protein
MQRACSRDAPIRRSLLLAFVNIANASLAAAERAGEPSPKIVEAFHGMKGPAAGSLTVWR